ncbi:MAG: ribonuclease HI [Magnetococcales bacterium]|nr:ribonuclease HI [Magnetococcales bacterium]
MNHPDHPSLFDDDTPTTPSEAPIEIFTDGACSGNPGPGGWGALIDTEGQKQTWSGYAQNTTNNRMELLAAIHPLEQLPAGSHLKVVTDSVYVKNGITQWIHGWKKRNWRKSGGGKVLNKELWQRLEAAAARHTVTWQWVKGHAGHPGNEKADTLAREAIIQGENGMISEDPAG